MYLFVCSISEISKLNGNLIGTDLLRRIVNILGVINVFKINVLLLFCLALSVAEFGQVLYIE